MPRPVTVAVTGGIGAGKSTAVESFRRHGAETLSSDEIVHRLYREDAEVRAAVRERFGGEVFGQDGEVDRRRLGALVFADPEQLAWLEALLHPKVVQEYTTWRTELERSESPPSLIVVEIPLLFETGGETRFDKVVAITAPAEVRTARRGPSAERETRLLSDEEKVRRADFAYENTGTPEDLDRFVGDVVEELSRS